ETIRDILDACPSVDWRLLVALARLAGLRCPSEIGALTWGDINWEKGR
ncbi:MAG TPA: integrase, partial [Planctomycetaceae bacterium]|nr:integrase [Planctomycetaceae bacterium]